MKRAKLITLIVLGFIAANVSARGKSDANNIALIHEYLCPGGKCPGSTATTSSSTVTAPVFLNNNNNAAFSSPFTSNPASTDCLYYINKFKSGGLSFYGLANAASPFVDSNFNPTNGALYMTGRTKNKFSSQTQYPFTRQTYGVTGRSLYGSTS